MSPADRRARAYKKKLQGWLSYAFASEVFVIVSLTLFSPICLEQFARDNGYFMPDRKVPCIVSKQSLNTTAGDSSQNADLRCAVKVAWFWIDTASFSLYIYSISVALQAITVISIGGIANNPLHRKRVLLFFAFLGSLSATLFLLLPSSSPVWYLSALLAMCANVGFGASIVAMNAYLPSLASESPEVVQILHTVEADDEDTENPTAPLISDSTLLVSDAYTPTATSLPSSSVKSQYDETLSRAISRISSRGIALGYAAGIILLIIALIPVARLHGSTFALRLAIGLSGLWWMFFTIPAALWLPGMDPSTQEASDSPGSADSAWGDVPTGDLLRSSDWNLRRGVIQAWKKLGHMLRWGEIKKLKNTFIYLAAWFLLSDGFTTITSTAVLFGKTVLHMPPSSLIIIGIFTPTAGILGSLMWPSLQKRFGWSNLRVLVVLVLMASVVPAYGCLGFLFKSSTFQFGGLTTPGEMYVLAVYFGSVYGAFQGYARASYAELLPPGEEARWYALFSITDKSSSFLGPLVVGLISDLTGNIRYSFFFLVLMVWAAVPILTCVNVEEGRRDAREYTESYI
ncbi:autophagy-type protein 22 [Amanita rubescens]|nr:autophagy-type protein 22 [Amanita rubescens]